MIKFSKNYSGGLPYGVDPFDNMVKEAQEEAGIPSEIASKCKPCGTVTFYVSCDRGWIPDLEFNYDIELPADFIPKPMDGEVVDFQLMDEETVRLFYFLQGADIRSRDI